MSIGASRTSCERARSGLGHARHRARPGNLARHRRGRFRSAEGAIAEGAVCRFRSCRVGLPPDQVGVGNRLHAPGLRDRRQRLAAGIPGFAPGHFSRGGPEERAAVLLEGGADLNSEPPMVLGATGPNRTFQNGDVLYIDGGCNVSGYKMDFARRAVFGPPSARQQSEHDGMWGILHEIIERMKPGVSMRELFEYSQSRLAQHPEWRNYSDHPSKRIGHGIGLENEPPSISANRRYGPRSRHGADAGAENRKRGRSAQSGGTRRHPSVGLRGAFRGIGVEAAYRRLSGTRFDENQTAQRTEHPRGRPDAAGDRCAGRTGLSSRRRGQGRGSDQDRRASGSRQHLSPRDAGLGGRRPRARHEMDFLLSGQFRSRVCRIRPASSSSTTRTIGLPCCIMEGMYVTFLRTAACAAVAAKYLAPRPPKTLGLIGCGGLGLWSLRVMSATFPSIERVFVSSRTRKLAGGVLREDDAGGQMDHYTR